MIQPEPFLPAAIWNGCLFDDQWRKCDDVATVTEPATGKQLGQIGMADAALACLPPCSAK